MICMINRTAIIITPLPKVGYMMEIFGTIFATYLEIGRVLPRFCIPHHRFSVLKAPPPPPPTPPPPWVSVVNHFTPQPPRPPSEGFFSINQDRNQVTTVGLLLLLSPVPSLLLPLLKLKSLGCLFAAAASTTADAASAAYFFSHHLHTVVLCPGKSKPVTAAWHWPRGDVGKQRHVAALLSPPPLHLRRLLLTARYKAKCYDYSVQCVFATISGMSLGLSTISLLPLLLRTVTISPETLPSQVRPVVGESACVVCCCCRITTATITFCLGLVDLCVPTPVLLLCVCAVNM
jgi:hypothetical protein